MNRAEAPELLALKLRLSIATHINEGEFGYWLLLNLPDLRIRFHDCGEPDSTVVEYTFGIWARLQFLNRAREVAV